MRLDLAYFNNELNNFLNIFFTRQSKKYCFIGEEFTNFYNKLTDFTLNGGKRIRPNFIFLGWLSYTDHKPKNIPPELIKLATAFELVHSAALIHDDIIDDSISRRGKLTIHQQFKQDLTKANINDHTFSKSAALLLGDLALSWADDLYVGTKIPSSSKEKLHLLWETTRTGVIAGQFYDLYNAATRNYSLKSAQTVAELKTALYTMELPLAIGATYAKATNEQVTELKEFGKLLGVLFQLQDDFIGAFGDEDITGKPVGDDFMNQKMTTLILEAIRELEKYNPSSAQTVKNLLDSPKVTRENANQITQILKENRIMNSYLDKLNNLRAIAANKLKQLNINDYARELITNYSTDLFKVIS